MRSNSFVNFCEYIEKLLLTRLCVVTVLKTKQSSVFVSFISSLIVYLDRMHGPE